MPRIDGSVRLEDYLMPLWVILFVCVLFGRIHVFVLLSLFYIIYVTLSTSIFYFFSDSNLVPIIILGKEAQYIICGIIVYNALNFNNALTNHKKLLYYFSLLMKAAIVFCLYTTLSGDFGYYGIGYFTELDSPSLSTVLYLSISFYFFIFDRFNNNRTNIFWIYLSAIMAFLVGSRTGMVASLIFLVYYSYIINFLNWLKILKFSFWFFCSFMFLFFLLPDSLFDDYLNPILNLIARIDTFSDIGDTLSKSRGDVLVQLIEYYRSGNLLQMIFGYGRGASLIARGGDFDQIALAGDNYIFSSLVEIGLLGTLYFLSINIYLYFLIKNAWIKHSYLLLFFIYIIYGLTIEIWLLSKSGQVWWLLVFVMLNMDRLYSNSNVFQAPSFSFNFRINLK
jgi:hypothetical protein